VAVDGLGNPIRWLLTGGEVHDSTQAQTLIEGMEAQSVLADKAMTPTSLCRLSSSRCVLSFRQNAIESSNVSMISRCIKSEIWLSDFLVASSTLEESPRDMKNWTEISCRLSISFLLIFGWLKC
jgi:hypothetical protein